MVVAVVVGRGRGASREQPVRVCYKFEESAASALPSAAVEMNPHYDDEEDADVGLMAIVPFPCPAIFSFSHLNP